MFHYCKDISQMALFIRQSTSLDLSNKDTLRYQNVQNGLLLSRVVVLLMPPNKKYIRIFAHSNHYLLLVEVYYYAKNRLGFTMVGKPASFNSSNFFQDRRRSLRHDYAIGDIKYNKNSHFLTFLGSQKLFTITLQLLCNYIHMSISPLCKKRS